MKKYLLFYLLGVGLLFWFFSADAILAGSETVTVSPSNLNKEVKFYSEYVGQMHTLMVQAASGFKFKSGPSLSLNPESLWSSSGSNSFKIADMEDRTEISAKVEGVLVPDGNGGGSGTPPEYPFEISMITRYFRMEFIEPTEDTEFIKDENIPVAVSLLNSIGLPASGSVIFNSVLGSFGNNTATVQSGLAGGILTVTAGGGTKGKISASASQIDITDGKIASGEKESDEFTAWELKYNTLYSIADSASEPVEYDPITGKVMLYIRQQVFGVIKVKPRDIPDNKIDIRIVQDVVAYREYVYNSPPPGKTKRVLSTNGSRFLDVIHLSPRRRDGESMDLIYEDEPRHGWSSNSSALWSSLSVSDSFICYLQVKFSSQNEWKTLGKLI